MKINSEKCYLIGLLIGGGIIKSNQLQIVLPYKKWGSLKINPERGGGIAEDILKRAKPLWKIHYDVDVSYKIDKDWKIIFNSISDVLKNDLAELCLTDNGDFRENANLSKLIPLLENKEFARSFLAGIIDTVGSLAASHRRFSSEFQIVSLEFKGRNFSLVSSVIELLSEINCIPDQILWNHPNQHSGHDRYYKSWKKGFKIRVALDDYLLRGSFVFETKQLSANENKKLQNKKNTAEGKISKIEGRTTLHVDENSNWLPKEIKGYHFIHYTHIAEFLGVKLPGIRIKEIKNFEQFVCPFTVLTKGTSSEIRAIIAKEEYLRKSVYTYKSVNIEKLLGVFEENKCALLFGKTKNDGFPVNYILQAISFIFCATEGKNIMGKRVLGNYISILKDNSKKFSSLRIGIPNRGTCLNISNKKYSALVGYINNEFNKKLVSVDGIRVKLKNPNFDECEIIK